MERALEIVAGENNPFIAIYRLGEYGWEVMGWWLAVVLVVQFLLVGYLYERYIAGTRTWNFY